MKSKLGASPNVLIAHYTFSAYHSACFIDLPHWLDAPWERHPIFVILPSIQRLQYNTYYLLGTLIYVSAK